MSWLFNDIANSGETLEWYERESTPIYWGKECRSVILKNYTVFTLFYPLFLHSLRECDLGWTEKNLHSYTITILTKIEKYNASISWRKG